MKENKTKIQHNRLDSNQNIFLLKFNFVILTAPPYRIINK